MNADPSRRPQWTKSMAQLIEKETRPPSVAASVSAVTQRIEPSLLAAVGLSHLHPIANEPRLLLQQLQADDVADGKIDLDEFARGLRRSVRLRIAFQARLHQRVGERWAQWVPRHFQAGYPCYQRYHLAAELQLGLAQRGLPLLENENQARALTPYRRHEKFWEVMASFSGRLPHGRELRDQVKAGLGLDAPEPQATPRIHLHRALRRLLQRIPVGNADPLVQEAASLVNRAIHLLEKGTA